MSSDQCDIISPNLHAIKLAADNIFDILFNGGHKI